MTFPYYYERTGLTVDSRIKPINYNLSLFDLEFGGKWGYSGLVKIDAKVAEPTEEIVINTKELEIQSAEVFSADGNCMCRS
jgi:aminopeptidase N